MRKKRAYFVGIKGVAMTAMAVYLLEKGYEVSGSDIPDIFPTDSILKKNQIEIKTGFNLQNLKGKYDLVIVTGAHGGMTNPEAQHAKELDIPTFMHGEMMGKIMEGKIGISVAGCHGKTTTSCIIAHLLTKLGMNPSYVIGTSNIKSIGNAGHYGKGEYFVAEADEYMTCPITDNKPRFLWQNPRYLVITNIEYDHPDAYANLDAVINAFKVFIQKVPDIGMIVACMDNKNIRDIISETEKPYITYGFSPASDYTIGRYSFDEGMSFMTVKCKNIDLSDFMLQIPGRHNLLNALGAAIIVNQLGVKWDKISNHMKEYSGCKRRFEKIGKYGNILFYDDYAHHPSEIQATLKATRDWYKKRRIITIFQPHTFSRTRALLSDFAKSFYFSDIAIVTDIYPSAREKFDTSISSRLLEIEMNKYKRNAFYCKDKKSVISFLDKNIKDGDLVMTLGAGDIYTWQTDISNLLFNKSK